MAELRVSGSPIEVDEILSGLPYDYNTLSKEMNGDIIVVTIKLDKPFISRDIENYLTVKQVEQAYGLKNNTLLNDIFRDGKFDAQIEEGLITFKGRQWLIHKEAVLALMGDPKDDFPIETPKRKLPIKFKE